MASDSPRTVNGFLVFIGTAAAFAGVILVTVGVLALNRPSAPTLDQKRGDQRKEVAARVNQEALDKINTAGWVDKAKGTVHASVADVMPLVVAELRAKKPAPSQVKIDPMLPMPVIDPKATEPPPPALTSSPQGADTIRFTAPAAPEVAPAPPAPAPAPQASAPAAPVPAAPAPAPSAPEKLTPQPTAPLPPPAPAAPAPAPAPAAPENAVPPAQTNPTENSAPTK